MYDVVRECNDGIFYSFCLKFAFRIAYGFFREDFIHQIFQICLFLNANVIIVWRNRCVK